MSKRKKSFVSLAIVIAAIVASQIVPLPEGLTRPGLSSIVLLLGAIFLWVMKAMPMAITSFAFVTMMPFFGICKLNDVFVRMGNSTFFFMVATYALTMAIESSTIPNRVSVFLMRRAGKSSVKLLFFFAMGTAAFSSIMSNIPSCAIFCALILALYRESKEMQENKALVKVLLISVTYGAVIGGFVTPAGSSANIFSMNLFEELTGKTFSFLDWTLIGLPTVVVSMILCCLVLLVVFRPKPLTDETLLAVERVQATCGPMTARDWKIVVITGAMLVCWVLGAWVPVLNSTAVALLGMCLFFAPGIEVLEWGKFSSDMSWGTVFLVGGSGALAMGINTTGADIWMVKTVLPDVSSLSPFILILLMSVVTAVLHMLIPSGSATVAIAMPTFLQLFSGTGMSEYTIMMVCTLWSCVVFTMPFDAVTMVSYNTGHYEFKDLLKGGLVAYLVIIPVAALVIQLMCGVVF